MLCSLSSLSQHCRGAMPRARGCVPQQRDQVWWMSCRAESSVPGSRLSPQQVWWPPVAIGRSRGPNNLALVMWLWVLIPMSQTKTEWNKYLYTVSWGALQLPAGTHSPSIQMAKDLSLKHCQSDLPPSCILLYSIMAVMELWGPAQEGNWEYPLSLGGAFPLQFGWLL